MNNEIYEIKELTKTDDNGRPIYRKWTDDVEEHIIYGSENSIHDNLTVFSNGNFTCSSTVGNGKIHFYHNNYNEYMLTLRDERGRKILMCDTEREYHFTYDEDNTGCCIAKDLNNGDITYTRFDSYGTIFYEKKVSNKAMVYEEWYFMNEDDNVFVKRRNSDGSIVYDTHDLGKEDYSIFITYK